jgi:hypothetical protein
LNYTDRHVDARANQPQGQESQRCFSHRGLGASGKSSDKNANGQQGEANGENKNGVHGSGKSDPTNLRLGSISARDHDSDPSGRS